MEVEYQWDYFVIGGGSGGLASAKAAASYGAKVAIADYVKPSPPGTTWGLGGTCVNVGCIPKKLMHFSATLGDMKADQIAAGWEVDPKAPHDWKKMISAVQRHIVSLNWGYKGQLQEKSVKYYNRLASLVDAHTVQLFDPKTKKTDTVTAKFILIAVGGRPTYPDNIEGIKDVAITSDDLFSMKEAPGKTLVVGASYVALECAGFLQGLGYDTTVMVRSILLRGFDQQMANKIGEYMEEHGLKFIKQSIPHKVVKNEDGTKTVFWKDAITGEEKSDVYKTIMWAIGRTADTHLLNLDTVGIQYDKVTKKILAKDNDQTTVENIYAIGDVAKGRLELTPTAIMAGRLLSARLFNKSTREMNYRNVATTVFTPIEYGCVGFSEEDAIATYTADNLVIYNNTFKPLEWNYLETRSSHTCYIKMICDKTDNEKVLGLHYLGPHAGEIIQGYSVAVRMGAYKNDFDLTVGIHPTCAEEVLGMKVTKAEGEGDAGGC
jgi:thioredoxin reductase (NADPH)